MLKCFCMKNIKFIYVTYLFVFLSACTVGEVETKSSIFKGQWTKPEAMDNGKFLIEGYNTRDAMNGATEFCGRTGKTYNTLDLTLSSANTRALLLFKCK